MNKIAPLKLSRRDRLKFLLKGEIPMTAVPHLGRAPSDYDPADLSHLDAARVIQIFREAESGDVRKLFSLYRDIVVADSHLQAELSKRKIATLGDAFNVHPVDEDSEEDETSATVINQMHRNCKGWIRSLSHLLDGCLWPVSVVQKRYIESANPNLDYELAELVPVDHDYLDFRSGRLMIRDYDSENRRILDTCHEPSPDRYIIHRGHILSAPDQWGGPMRSVVWWYFLSTQSRTWWAQFLDHYGMPWAVGKYDQNDDASRSILYRAFQKAKRIGGLVISKQTEVELVEAAKNDSGEAYGNFITLCQREKSKLILGQTLSAEAQGTGLGSGVADSQESVRQDIRQFDSLLLGQSLRDQLFSQYLNINGFAGQIPEPTWGAESSEETEVTGALMAALREAGLELTEDGIEILSRRTGFPLRRAAIPPSDSKLSAFSADAEIHKRASEDIPKSGSADLVQAFSGNLAPVRQIIAESTSADDLAQKIRSFYSDWTPGKVTRVIDEALFAFSANAAQSAD